MSPVNVPNGTPPRPSSSSCRGFSTKVQAGCCSGVCTSETKPRDLTDQPSPRRTSAARRARDVLADIVVVLLGRTAFVQLRAQLRLAVVVQCGRGIDRAVHLGQRPQRGGDRLQCAAVSMHLVGGQARRARDLVEQTDDLLAIAAARRARRWWAVGIIWRVLAVARGIPGATARLSGRSLSEGFMTGPRTRNWPQRDFDGIAQRIRCEPVFRLLRRNGRSRRS